MRIPLLPALVALLIVFAVAEARAFGDPLVEISHQRHVGEATGIAALAGGEGHLPALLEQRIQRQGHLRILTLAGASYDETRLKEAAVGIATLGSTVVMATASDSAITLTEIRLDGRKVRGNQVGAESLVGLRNWNALQVGAGPDGAILILAHDAGLTVAAPLANGKGASSLLARPGLRAIAATPPFRMDRDDRLDILVATADARLLHIEGNGTAAGFTLSDEFTFSAPGFVPRCMVGEGGELWIGGTMNGRATLLLLSAAKPLRPWIPIKVKTNRYDITGTLDFGAGSIDEVCLLDRGALAAGGTRDGRAWVGVVERSRIGRVLHESTLSGTAVTALAVNPSRAGWSLAAGTNDKTFYVLRIASDRPFPRDWIPFPVEQPEPPAGTMGHDGCGTGGAGHGAEETMAIFPRVATDARRGLETELTLVYLGAAPAKISLSLTNDTGQVVYRSEMILRRGQRARVPLGPELVKQRVYSFDGYAVVAGCAKRDLVAEAVLLAGTAAPETLQPHWR